MKYCCLFLLILNSFVLSAQEQPYLDQIADKHFVKYEYALAAPLYERLLDKRKIKKEWLYKAAFCYESMLQYERAVHWYKQLLQKDTAVKPDLILHAADLMKTLLQTDTAVYWYEQYRLKGGDSLKAVQRIHGALMAPKWIKNPTKHKIVNKTDINTNLSDWGTSLYKDELIYVSEQKRKINGAYEDNNKIYSWNDNPYLSLQVTNQLKQGALIHEIIQKMNDHDYHVGPVVFTKNIDTLYYTRTYRKANDHFQKPFKRFRVATRHLEILYIFKTGLNTWSKPKELISGKGTQFSIGHAALSKNGDTLYFASDMPGGYGKTDLWYCEKTENGGWSAPKNCGDIINTSDEEAFPVVDPNSGHLYFASTGHTGMGGFDIFQSIGSGSNWTHPKNLFYPINSTYDDFYFVVKNNYEMYLSSNRPEGKGSDDIYAVILPIPQPDTPKISPRPNTIVIRTKVLHKQTKEPISSSLVQLTNMLENSKENRESNEIGLAYHTVPCNSHYRIKATKQSFTADSTGLIFPDCLKSDTLDVVLYLNPPVQKVDTPKIIPPVKRTSRFKVGDTFILNDLYYDLDKYNIRPDAAKVLDSLIAILNTYPEIDIELSSHTDSRASDAYNDKLSQNRATSAVNYLIKHGIDRKRLQARGYGEKRLRNHCADGVKCPEPLHQLNRRTEVRVTNVRPLE